MDPNLVAIECSSQSCANHSLFIVEEKKKHIINYTFNFDIILIYFLSIFLQSFNLAPKKKNSMSQLNNTNSNKVVSFLIK